MPSVLDLGKLVSYQPGEGAQLLTSFSAFGGLENDQGLTTNDVTPPTIDNKTIADKAVEDSKDAPSVWFVNFPTAEAAAQQKLLAEYMQSVSDSRCWASLLWWSFVFKSDKIKQDGSKASAAARSSFCAKVGAYHTRVAPWLEMTKDENISKTIKCRAIEFHLKLIENVLQGFVESITPAAFVALEEVILKSLAKSPSQTSDNSETKTIICERYEYLAETDVITSYVRMVNFSVSDAMGKVNNTKETDEWVTCEIEYNEYEALFNHNIWLQVSEEIDGEKKTATADFVKSGTVDCPP